MTAKIFIEKLQKVIQIVSTTDIMAILSGANRSTTTTPLSKELMTTPLDHHHNDALKALKSHRKTISACNNISSTVQPERISVIPLTNTGNRQLEVHQWPRRKRTLRTLVILAVAATRVVKGDSRKWRGRRSRDQ